MSVGPLRVNPRGATEHQGGGSYPASVSVSLHVISGDRAADAVFSVQLTIEQARALASELQLASVDAELRPTVRFDRAGKLVSL